MTEQRDQEFIQNKQDFSQFLDPDNGDSGEYSKKIENLLSLNDKRLIVNLNDVNEYDKNLRKKLLQKPMELLPAWEDSLKDYVNHSDLINKNTDVNYKIGFSGAFGSNNVRPSTLMSASLNKMVCCSGIVTKVTVVRPKVVSTVHYCEETKKFKEQTYRDNTSLTGLPTSSAYPTKDENGNKLITEFGLSKFMDYQRIIIQDMPEKTKAGQIPQSIECILNDDLVDKCKPGDRIKIIGIYRALGSKTSNGARSGKFKTIILVNNIIKIGKDNEYFKTLTINEIKNIKKISKRNDLFDLVSRSIVPSIHGHEYIKKGIVLQLFGGVEKNLKNGTHMRGDINILMIGDPSCGKSQLLRAVMNISSLAINTTGRGSSGVGLTAAVTRDKDSGERKLEAGAMVLADGGIVCIDEFDKMSDIDRTAIHEVMEQQTVTIAKAGIQTSLNARCSVIAAANPVYGMYDRSRKPFENIGLPDSLLSRFDLLFIVLDKINNEIDRNISQHVLSMHLTPYNYNNNFDDDDIDIDIDINDDKNNNKNKKNRKKKDSIFNKNIKNNLLSGTKHTLDYLEINFIKKYIEFCKKQIKPVLTNESCEIIAQKYRVLRIEKNNLTLPITARCLESIIRLSTAHAKMRLSKKISEIDVENAINVLEYALTNDAMPQNNKGTRNDNDDSGMDDDDMDDDMDDMDNLDNNMDDDNDINESKSNNDNNRRRSRRRSEPDIDNNKQLPKTKRKRLSILNQSNNNNKLNMSNVNYITKYVSKKFKLTKVDCLKIDEIYQEISDNDSDYNITYNEYKLILEYLHENNKLFILNDEIHQL